MEVPQIIVVIADRGFIILSQLGSKIKRIMLYNATHGRGLRITNVPQIEMDFNP